MSKKGNPKIVEAGASTRFGNGQDATKGGRKKKIYTILKEKGFSKDDITTAFSEIMWYKLDELNEASLREDLPIITRIIANQFIQAYESGEWYKIKDLIDHTIGRPVQKNQMVDEDGKPTNPAIDWSKIPLDERIKFLETIEKAQKTNDTK